MRRSKYLSAALIVVAALSFTAGSVHAEIPGSDRTDTWEFYIPLRYASSKVISAPGGSSVDITDDVGWGFGFARNFSERLSLGFDMTFGDTSYDARIVDDSGSPPLTVPGTLETNAGSFNLQYNLIERTFTPFINVGAGWTYLDSNIPNGPPQGSCWWHPWYGQICTSWQPTRTDTVFSYSAAIGLRGELTDTFFLEGAYSEVWLDFDNVGTESFSGYRFDMGWRF